MTTRELARRLCCAHATATAAAERAEYDGVIVRLDCGTVNAEYVNEAGKRSVKRGLLSLWELPGQGESIYEVFAAASSDRMYLERIEGSKAIPSMRMRLYVYAITRCLYEGANSTFTAFDTQRAA